MRTAQFTCPKCKLKSEIEIPETYCTHAYNCPNCKSEIKSPKTESKKCNCIICSYTDKNCGI